MRRHAHSSNRFARSAWSNDLELLRAIAAQKLTSEKLQWWWCKKYGRPIKDPLLQEYTIEELQIEYLMYVIEEDPQQAYPRCDMANVRFRTDDDVINDWEKKLADGKDDTIDWDAGVDPTFLKRFKAYSRRVAEAQEPSLLEARLREEGIAKLPNAEHDEFLASLVGGFTDDYGAT